MSTFNHEPQPKKILTPTKLFAVFCIQLNEAYQIAVLLPMVVFMCRDFGISSKWLGVYTSILNASFGLCQFTVSYAWGYLSDIYGRRIILITGIIGTLSAMILFGFSNSFEWAIIARCLTGIFNGNLGVVKAYLADITDSTNRGFAFSIIGVAFGAGIILGSMLGGILIETSDVEASDEDYINTTSVLKWSIFQYDYPFLLPCLCGAIISGIALLCAILFVHNEKVNYDELDNSSEHNIATSVLSSNLEMTPTAKSVFGGQKAFQFDDTNSYDPAHHNSLPTPQEFNAMKGRFEPEQLKLLENVKTMENDNFNQFNIDQINTAKDLFKRTILGHSLLQYAIAALSHMMFKEMGPVYMAQALLFDSGFIGYTQAFGGAALFVFTLFMQPYLLKTVNHRKLCMFAAIGSVVICICMPSVYWFTFADNAILTELWFLLVMVCLIEAIFTGTFSLCFVVSGCYVNNSVPNTHVGKANGIGQTVAAFVRGVGPIITGFIWSESITRMEDGEHWLVYMAYAPAAILYGIMCFHLWCKIPSDLQFTWEHRAKNAKQNKGSLRT